MKVCFEDKEAAKEHTRLKLKLNRLEMLAFPSVLDKAERMYIREELQKLEDQGLVLYEPWHDFIPKMKSYSRRTLYRTERVILYKRYPFRLTEEELSAFVETLKRKYSKKGYELETKEFYTKKRRGIGRVKFYIVSRRVKGTINPPIYFDLKAGRCYIPKHFVKNYLHLSSAVVLYRLHPLGIV